MKKLILFLMTLFVVHLAEANTQPSAQNTTVTTSTFANCLTSANTNVQSALNSIDTCLASSGTTNYIQSLVKSGSNVSLVNDVLTPGNSKCYGTNASGVRGWYACNASTGSVTNVSVNSANGFGGTVTNPTTTPAISLTTSVNGILKGNGTSVSAATSGTDYAPATSGSSILYGNGAGGFSPVTIGSNLTFSGGTLSGTGSGSGTVSSGTVGQEAVYTGTTTVGSGIITDNGTNVGVGSTNPKATLDVNGNISSASGITSGSQVVASTIFKSNQTGSSSSPNYTNSSGLYGMFIESMPSG